MWIFALGETLKRATLTSHSATSRLSGELCRVLTDMTKPEATSRASLMHLLDIISEYCKRRQQTRPFSHIVMDLHQEAMAALETALDTPWGPPAMPELRSLTRNSIEQTMTMPRRWGLSRPQNERKLTREASTSMEELTFSTHLSNAPPGNVIRPKSMCLPEFFNQDDDRSNEEENFYSTPFDLLPPDVYRPSSGLEKIKKSNRDRSRRRTRKNPVQRAASRLYKATNENVFIGETHERNCIGPEFVVRASLASKQFTMVDSKGGTKKSVTVILLNGQKIDVLCNPNNTTAGQLFELIIRKEHIGENFMLGLSALIAGDFVFLPSDTRISKVLLSGGGSQVALTLFMRVRFFLPSLRGIRGNQARHLLYLQLRRSILEHQLPCSFTQLVELDGLALQAEFGDFNEREHGTRDYFLLEHYVPETMSCAVDDPTTLKYDLIRAHKYKKGLDPERAEEDFILLAQTLPHYGGHFYTATWALKDNNKNVWLYISAQGINIYERGNSSTHNGPMLCESFEWRSIQTLCYSKQYLCVLPHAVKLHRSKLKKYKLKMDHKKSYFTFRLASLHHQFFLRLRTEFTSLQSLSQQFGIPLKDIKNETNSLFKLESLTNNYLTLDKASVNAETEFRIEFCSNSRSETPKNTNLRRRSRSANDFKEITNIETFQNKENENSKMKQLNGLILDSSCLSGLPNATSFDKRRGVKMGIRAFGTNHRVSRSMEAVNSLGNEPDLEQLSLQSVSIHCSTVSTPQSPIHDAYIIGSILEPKSESQQIFSDIQESLSESLLNKLNAFSYDEERFLQAISLTKDVKGSLGIQITEGSDGRVYIQSVIDGGPAQITGKINKGDQIISVDGKNLLSMKYSDALDLLKSTNKNVNLILSQINRNKTNSKISKNLTINLSKINESHLKNLRLERTMEKLKTISIENETLEKHVTENCYDLSNLRKYNTIFNNQPEVPYHKHIRYEIEPKKNTNKLNKTISKSCNQIYTEKNQNDEKDRAIIVEMIPKQTGFYRSLDRKQELIKSDEIQTTSIALPRSLGLSRKWKGPVKYPVTPVKKSNVEEMTTSDEEQVFI
ncbi:tyrosine-protein phosphatase non-receptor type 13-like isoform X2 [Onthophagus taurus]